MTRQIALQTFLSTTGWDNADCLNLAADASFRSYQRLCKGNKTAVLMNAPPPENLSKFIFVDRLLEKAGMRVPHILALDIRNGFVLLEDFGDDTFTRLLAHGADEADLYRRAVQTLIQIQKNTQLPTADLPVFDFESMMKELSLLPDWYGQYVLPTGLPDTAREEFMYLWKPLIKRVQTMPKSFTLLDYHVDNLMITPDNACGLLDFQDARLGPALYDLMSLLEDERSWVNDTIVHEMISLYFTECPELDTPENRENAMIIAMQRHTKVAGIFVRLCVRDGKDRYLKMLPLVWKRIESHLSHPLFKTYQDWLNRYIPISVRHTIPTVEKRR